MEGWVLYKKDKSELNPDDDYSVVRLLEAAEAKDISLDVLKPEDFELIVSHDGEKSILVKGSPRNLPQFLIPRMGSGTTRFALAIIRQLTYLGVYCANSADAIDNARNKLKIHQLLAQSKLPTPKTMLVKFPVDQKLVARELGFPIIIKNVQGSLGQGIYLSDSEDRFTDLMELIYSNNENANLILQEYMKSSHGIDLRVFVLGGRVIGCMKRVSEGSFKANFSRGGKVEKFKLTPEVAWLATETARLVNLDIAGIDLLFDDQGYKICEANSAPMFKGLEQVTGKNIAEQILDYISVRVGKGLWL